MSTLSLDYPVAKTKNHTYALVLIALAHIALIYALKHGLVQKAIEILPKESIMMVVSPLPKPVELTPPPPPKVAKNTPQQPKISLPEVPVPVVQTAQTEPSITVKQTQTPTPAPVKAETPAPLAPVAATAPTQPKQISAVEYLQEPHPVYPPLSRRMGEEGKVTMRVLVNEKGQAEKVEVQKSSGFARLDEAAKNAILRALFKPYLEDGRALPMIATATVNFALDS